MKDMIIKKNLQLLDSGFHLFKFMRLVGSLAGLVPIYPAARCSITTTVPREHPQHYPHEALHHELLEALATDDRPSRVWAYYQSLISAQGHGQFPLEIHQQVLRKCAPSPRAMRTANVQKLATRYSQPSRPHIYEGRLQTVIRNIRLMNKIPELDDYHFILKHFAFVGHHVGALQVYKEVLRVGHHPDQKTFGYCLQALAHYLEFPVPRKERGTRTMECRKVLDELMASMRERGVPISVINLEMIIRVLKDTFDAEGFASLMKYWYGIDLSNPDCVPLEHSQNSDGNAWVPHPFTTMALNTTIDVLGRLGNVSKMVQAFEVLTNPLPAAQDHITSSFDDDGEDDFGVAVEPSQRSPTTLPYAAPNTTTFNI